MSGLVRRLLRALAADAAAAGCVPMLEHLAERPWATLTFTGARHTVRAIGEPAALARWLTMLPEVDLPLPGRFVASVAAEVTDAMATIELLVLEA